MALQVECSYFFLLGTAASWRAIGMNRLSVRLRSVTWPKNGSANLVAFSWPMKYPIFVWHTHLKILLHRKSLGCVKLSQNNLLIRLRLFIHYTPLKERRRTNECAAQSCYDRWTWRLKTRLPDLKPDSCPPQQCHSRIVNMLTRYTKLVNMAFANTTERGRLLGSTGCFKC